MRTAAMDAPFDSLARQVMLERDMKDLQALLVRVNSAALELRAAIDRSQRARDEARALRRGLHAALTWHIDRR
jgi:hypothetical protein